MPSGELLLNNTHQLLMSGSFVLTSIRKHCSLTNESTETAFLGASQSIVKWGFHDSFGGDALCQPSSSSSASGV